jgi:carboxyl-terminal processing protease
MRPPTRTARSSSFIAVLAFVTGLAGVTRAGPPPAAAAGSSVRATDANVTRITAELLEHSQFAHHPLDAELAGRLLDRYLDALDGTRSLFLQSDVAQFAGYKATLAQATRQAGDTTAARAIFARFLERLQQQAAYVAEVVKTDPFDFTGHETYSFDREKASRPADLTAARALWRQQVRAEYLQEKLAGKKPEEIGKLLLKRHDQQVKTMKGLRDEDVLEIFLDSLAHVYDPHSDYLGHEQMESFSIAMKLSLFGIGAVLESEDGYTKILELLPGGPAATSGLLKVGDRITAVAQAGKEPVDIVNMPLSHAVELIRGPKDTKVTLTILAADAPEGSPPKAITLVRGEIKLADQAAKAKIIDLPMGKGSPLRIGVIDLPSFYADMGAKSVEPRSATKDVARLLAKLKAENVRGIVMDLRRNGGGSLEEAISLTGLFIRKGPVVQTRDPSGKIEVGNDDDGAVAWDGPLVLLTSRFSASATEIMVGALQDYGRGVVVGDSSTFGKGTVQTLVPLGPMMDRAGLSHAYDPGALKVTISKFYRPSGASTQLRGVASDILLPSTTDLADVSEAKLKDPLPWDTVPAKPYEALNRVKPYVDKLRAGSASRVKSDPGFAYLAADVQRLKKRLASKSVSLNEAERKQELADEKAREAQHEAELKARAAKRPVAYAITLENADKPGLPPPVKPPKPEAKPDAGAASAADKRRSSKEGHEDDVVLDESQRILSDYIELLKPASQAGNRAAAR